MKTSELFRDLYRHMEWADALVWSSVLASPALRDDKVTRERLYHIHLVQRAFHFIWRGEPLDFKGTEGLTGQHLAAWGRAYHGAVTPFIACLIDSRLDDLVHLPWAKQIMERSGGHFADPRLGETIMQVPAHSTHHRGQVCARIREFGVEPPLTDFIAWIWSNKPSPLWPQGTEENRACA